LRPSVLLKGPIGFVVSFVTLADGLPFLKFLILSKLFILKYQVVKKYLDICL